MSFAFLTRAFGRGGPDEETEEPVSAPARASRRDRRAGRADAVVTEALSQKVLHAFLQNRHQTLVPLTLNLRVLEPAQRDLVIQAMAAAFLAQGRRQDPAPVRDALARISAAEAERQRLDKALAAPLALGDLLDAILDADLGAYAYVASLLAVDQRRRVNQLYLAYLAERLGLAEDVVSSLHRRYRV
ncbi:DUF533 domain-containing protein [Methylobacterium platani]|uniref:Tellurite resistance TerB family protein n=2 Tax=Methylobacterium platani TaxID=427683 RepID=A0A179SG25_9HYPH|nr:DUF533 domain-containing protein [Methylobacterium platani]KMO17179.1 hypothetical protein SQ03_13245 [Methylobacterium platani JCM 14648]OAS25825.1 hypothetical protein A5481_08305 [Methylobacterium platani]